MNLRRAAFIAACLFPIATGPAMAQFPPTPQEQAQQATCIQEFGKLRDEAQKRADAIRAASERKATAKEACGLFNAFSAAELKMIKYASDKAVSCSIPPQILETIKHAHVKTTEMRTQICRAAAAPVRPQAPSLSDVLGGSAVPDANNIKTGRGTFDTLTGTPLGSR